MLALWELCLSSFFVQLHSAITWKMFMLKEKEWMKCVMTYLIASCLCMFLALFLKQWRHLSLADSPMIWFTEHSLECCSETSSKVLCLMLLPDWEKRMRAYMMIKQTNATFAICQEKWWRRKVNLSQIIPRTNISYGIMFSTSLLLKEKTVMTILAWNMKFHKNIISQMRKWMCPGCHQRESLNSALLIRRTNWLNRFRVIVSNSRKN